MTLNTVLAITENLNKNKPVYIYGAGRFGTTYAKYLRELCGISISGFVVSKKSDCTSAENVSVVDYDVFGKQTAKDVQIIIAIKGAQLEIKTKLEMDGFTNVAALPDNSLGEISEAYYVRDFHNRIDNLSACKFELAYDNDRIEKYHVLMKEDYPNHSRYRVSFCFFTEEVEFKMKAYDKGNISNTLLKVDRYYSEDGVLANIMDLESSKIEIYKVTSPNNRKAYSDKCYDGTKLIVAGSVEHRDDVISDNTGDNISNRNKDYSEATALYWIWKNTTNQRYVGLCHYRRRMNVTEAVLQDLEKEKIDVVITPVQYSLVPLRDFFIKLTTGEDWDLLKKYVSEYGREYADIFDEYEKNYFYVPCNIALMKRNIFDKYCEFAFAVSEKIYQHYVSKGVVREDRYMGYLFENLLSIYLAVHKDLCIGVTDMIFEA